MVHLRRNVRQAILKDYKSTDRNGPWDPAGLSSAVPMAAVNTASVKAPFLVGTNLGPLSEARFVLPWLCVSNNSFFCL